MGDQAGVATPLAALLQRPAVLMAIGAALAPFLARAPPAAMDEGAARSRSRSNSRKGGAVPAQPPPPPPTAEQAMIALLRRQIASLEGIIHTLRRELAESPGEPAPSRSPTTTTAPAATTTKTATAAKKAAPLSWASPARGGQGGTSTAVPGTPRRNILRFAPTLPPHSSPVPVRVDKESQRPS